MIAPLDPKSRKSTILLVRVAPDLVARLDARVAADGTTRSKFLRGAILAALDAPRKGGRRRRKGGPDA